REKFILERLIPIIGETDLITKTSYEPLWCFMDKNGGYLPPKFEACRFIVESMYEAVGKANTHTRYKDKNVSREEKKAEILKVEADLFGNETEMTDNLHIGAGITVPEMPSKLIH
ncbi:MAG TPA: hypothetical protein VNX68_10235, partial [Nitrosopumilaceae archaeon]|nr:hypothetical protein [Nitrosopumilaceae archaeon]